MAKMYDNGIYREITEKDLLQATNVETTPTLEERLYALENAVADLSLQTMGVDTDA